MDDRRRDGDGRTAHGRRLTEASSMGFQSFAVMGTGRASADGELAEGVAEAMIYITRIADTIGYNLGAGTLESVEFFGQGSAHATVTAGMEGQQNLRGIVAESGSLPEEARVWLESRSTP
jgi:hypothetical protein